MEGRPKTLFHFDFGADLANLATPPGSSGTRLSVGSSSLGTKIRMIYPHAELNRKGVRRSTLAFGVWRLAFGVWRLAFGVWRLAFGVWRLAFGVYFDVICEKSIQLMFLLSILGFYG